VVRVLEALELLQVALVDQAAVQQMHLVAVQLEHRVVAQLERQATHRVQQTHLAAVQLQVAHLQVASTK
jgi:hypothetical protein